MDFETLEQRTLFAGANETADTAAIPEVSFDMLPELAYVTVGLSEGAEVMPMSALNIMAGEAIEGVSDAVNDYIVAPAVEFYNETCETLQDYYNNPIHLAGDTLYGVGKGLEYLGWAVEGLGHAMDGLGEGLSEYSGTVKHVGRLTILGSVGYSYMYDPTLTTMYTGATIGAATYVTSMVMPYTGTISSAMGSVVEFVGSSLGSLGSTAADYGSGFVV